MTTNPGRRMFVKIAYSLQLGLQELTEISMTCAKIFNGFESWDEIAKKLFDVTLLPASHNEKYERSLVITPNLLKMQFANGIEISFFYSKKLEGLPFLTISSPDPTPRFIEACKSLGWIEKSQEKIAANSD